MFERLGQASVFSKMDMKTRFHQILIRLEDFEKTGFNTQYGRFNFLVMPIGLCTAPTTFQSLKISIFYDHIDDFVVVYINDFLVYSKTKEDQF